MPERVRGNLTDKLVPALVVVVVAMAFGMGAMWNKLQDLSKTKTVTPVASTTPAQAAPATPTISLDTIKGIFSKNVIKFGDGKSKLLLVEVADPSCPYCHVAGGENSSLNKQMGSQFTLVADGGTYVAPVTEMRKLVDQGKADFAWVYFPGHGNGEMGTKALYCGFDQGKFWQIHDKLMSSSGYDLLNTTVKNDKTKTAELVKFLQGAADTTKLKDCIDSGKYDARLNADTQLASSLGVNGTPGFFVNDKSFAGAYNWKDMKSVADAALQ